MMEKSWKFPSLFCQNQDQDQDFIFRHRGASRPRPWSRGRHHWLSFDRRSSLGDIGCNI